MSAGDNDTGMESDVSIDDDVVIQSYTVSNYGKPSISMSQNTNIKYTLYPDWLHRPVNTRVSSNRMTYPYKPDNEQINCSDSDASDQDLTVDDTTEPNKHTPLKRVLCYDDSSVHDGVEIIDQFVTPVSKRLCTTTQPYTYNNKGHDVYDEYEAMNENAGFDTPIAIVNTSSVADGIEDVESVEVELDVVDEDELLHELDSDCIDDMDDVDNGSDDEPKATNNTQWISKLKVGDVIDCLDCTKRWYQSQIIETCVSGTPAKIKVHYKGWGNKFDEVIDCNTESHRLAPQRTHTTKPYCNYYFTALTVGDSVDVRIDGRWIVGDIIDCNENSIQVLTDDDVHGVWYERSDTLNLAKLHKYSRQNVNTNSNKDKIIGRIVIDDSDSSEVEGEPISSEEIDEDEISTSESISDDQSDTADIVSLSHHTDINDADSIPVNDNIDTVACKPHKLASDALKTTASNGDAETNSNVTVSVVTARRAVQYGISAIRRVGQIGMATIGVMAVNAMYKACQETL